GWRGRLRLAGNVLAELWTLARFVRSPSQGFRVDPQRFFDPAAHSGAAYARLRLDKAELRPILLAASKRKAWLNDVLLAALLRAFADLAPATEAARWRALTFVNLRRFLPEDYAVPPCNLLGNHMLDLGTDLASGLTIPWRACARRTGGSTILPMCCAPRCSACQCYGGLRWTRNAN
uniref:hypothetical protein n=1 Tax=Methylogaea oryzae TaxID=1295382 RepID=UPI00138F49A4